jgi:hypothetical protein
MGHLSKTAGRLQMLFMVGLAVFLLSSSAEAEIKVLNLRHVSSDSVLPMVRELLGKRGTVCEWENRLILNASRDEIATIEEVLEQIDVPPVMLRITVRTEKRRIRADNPTGFSGIDPKDSQGTTLGTGNQGQGVTGRFSGWRSGNAGGATEYFLRVKEGGTGFIMIGKSVPYVRELLVLAHRHGGYRQTLDFQAINSGFWIRPVLEGDVVYVDIRPHLEGFQKNAAGLTGLPTPIELQSLETSVRVPLGRWVDLAGVLREGDEISRAIVAWKLGNSREETSIWLKIDRQRDGI